MLLPPLRDLEAHLLPARALQVKIQIAVPQPQHRVAPRQRLREYLLAVQRPQKHHVGAVRLGPVNDVLTLQADGPVADVVRPVRLELGKQVGADGEL